ncbi:MAG: class I SAM-dependent methyltransferase [Planctomycetes bacterium]|nr:class I SAM-dependent methyltransferase [Planctomycetota bacterium]MCL4730436.1 methyltransferase domain-containing protein [Planctomycetota bacterium]
MADAKDLSSLKPPPDLPPLSSVADTAAQSRWENSLRAFFEQHWRLFTPFEDYFRLRALEFRALRQLLPRHFDPARPCDHVAEIGCGYGFVSALLAPMARRLRGFDIPEKYAGYVPGDYENSTQIARLVVNGVLGIDRAEFAAAWPHALPCAEGELDLVFSMYVLEHIADLAPVARELARVVRPGGHAIHVVPSTVDMFFAYTRAQLSARYRGVLKGRLWRLLGRATPHTGTGAVHPPLHSEFARSFEDQLRIYSLESYLFPFIEHGFALCQVLQTREQNRVLVLQRES